MVSKEFLNLPCCDLRFLFASAKKEECVVLRYIHLFVTSTLYRKYKHFKESFVVFKTRTLVIKNVCAQTTPGFWASIQAALALRSLFFMSLIV